MALSGKVLPVRFGCIGHLDKGPENAYRCNLTLIAGFVKVKGERLGMNETHVYIAGYSKRTGLSVRDWLVPDVSVPDLQKLGLVDIENYSIHPLETNESRQKVEEITGIPVTELDLDLFIEVSGCETVQT
jgi:hypothetical protein